jgi:hypothetical protein
MHAYFERGLTIKLTLDEARSASHPGQCGADVRALSLVRHVARQLAKLDKVAVREELRSYGAWDDEELLDNEQNLQRLLWLAAGDIADQGYSRGRS